MSQEITVGTVYKFKYLLPNEQEITEKRIVTQPPDENGHMNSIEFNPTTAWKEGGSHWLDDFEIIGQITANEIDILMKS